MASHNKVGEIGEQLASEYLSKEGYVILETNWRHSRAEIDIIAKKDEVLVFVEVKTRRSLRNGNPELAISPKKVAYSVDAATRYMEEVNHEWEIRFDVITVLLESEEEYCVNHLKDSFSPWDTD